jgi:branched-chain amino acid transport system permease protein
VRKQIGGISLNSLVVLGLVLLGFISGPSTKIGLFQVFVVAMLAISWDILSRAGLVSLGQGAFFGLAGYVTAIFTSRGFDFLLAAAIGLICLLVFCILLGFATLRVNGIYFSLVTLALGLTGQAVILIFPDITGGAGGITTTLFAGGDLTIQLIILGAGLLVSVLISEYLLHSRFGNISYTMRDAPHVTLASGLNLSFWRTTALVISGLIAALTGILYGGLYGIINYDDVLKPNWSILAIAAAVIGGVDSTLGSIIGAAAIVLANQFFSGTFGAGYNQIAYGVLLILVLLFMPGGLMTPIRLAVNKISRLIQSKRKPGAYYAETE